MKNLIANWKTTSAGLTMIIGAVVHLVFAVKGHTGDENTWTTSLLAIAGGIGLMFAGDSTASAQDHADSKAAIEDLKSKVATSIQSGDTSILTKPALQTPAAGAKSAP